MTEDIYEQIEKKKNKKKKVASRSHDGFSDYQERVNGSQSTEKSSDQSKTKKLSSMEEAEEDLVYTAKPKSIALEVEVKQEIDEYLFHHKEVSWDTLIEAAIVHALHSDNHEIIIEDAANRLVQRKKSSTKRRIQTMTQNMYNK